MNRGSAMISMSMLTFLICCSSLTRKNPVQSSSQNSWKDIVNEIVIMETRAFDAEGAQVLTGRVLPDIEARNILEKAGLEAAKARTIDYSIIGKFVRHDEIRAFLMLEKTDGITNTLYLLTMADDGVVDGMEVSTSDNPEHPNIDSSSLGLPFLMSTSIIAPINDLSPNYKIHKFFFPVNNHTLNDETSDSDWHEEEFIFGTNGVITSVD